MRRLLTLRSDTRGLGTAEFALIAPILFTLIIGISQLGVLFVANAGLRNALSEGARYATIYPRPTADQIKAKIATNQFGLKSQYLGTPTVVSGTSGSTNYYDITMTYSVPLNFIFFTVPSVTLSQTRRVYVQPSS